MTIAYPNDGALARLAAGLCDTSLPKAEWTHAAHFGATLWLLRHARGFDARRDLPGLIRRYNIASGGVNSDTAGYHETITQASLGAAMASLAAADPAAPLHVVLDGLLAGAQGDRDWLFTHWRRGVLMTATARRSWVPPDLAPLPW